MTTKKLSLNEFAKSKERAKCVVCVLPEREEIDEAYRGGVTRKIILSWLWEVKGYEGKAVFDESGAPRGLSSTSLDHHLTGQHHFQKAE
jgi:hypothetical protein